MKAVFTRIPIRKGRGLWLDYIYTTTTHHKLKLKLKLKHLFNSHTKEMALAPKIDVKSLDEKLENLHRLYSMKKKKELHDKESNKVINYIRAVAAKEVPQEEWQMIIREKLVVKQVFARGGFGCVHKGIYDGQEVAGTVIISMFTCANSCVYICVRIILSNFTEGESFIFFLDYTVKVMEWGEVGRTKSEITSLKKDFRQEISVWRKLDHPNITKVRTTYDNGY